MVLYPKLAVECAQAQTVWCLFMFLYGQDWNLTKAAQTVKSFSYTISLVFCTSNKIPSTSPYHSIATHAGFHHSSSSLSLNVHIIISLGYT